MPKGAGSGLITAFQFRRRAFGTTRLPLVIQPLADGRALDCHANVAEAIELPYYRASGVSSFIKDESGIATWKINGSMWAVAHDPDLLLSVQAVDDFESDEGKLRMRYLRDEAEIKGGMVAKRERGTAMHALFVSATLGRTLPRTLAEQYVDLIAAHQRMVSLFDISGFELPIVCDEIRIAGNLDIMASPRAAMTPVNRKGERIARDVEPGEKIVLDVKTSSGCTYMGEHALQLAPYANSVGYREIDDPEVFKAQVATGKDPWKPERKRARIGQVIRTPHGARTDVALILHADSAGTEVHLHWLDLAKGYEQARHAMKTRDYRNELESLCADAEPPSLLDVLATVSTREEAEKLWRLHREVWTDAHTIAVNTALGQGVA